MFVCTGSGGIVEYRMDTPRLRKGQLGVRWRGGDDFEGSVTSWGQLFLRWMVWMLVPSSQTKSFSLKVRDGASGPTRFMTSAATRRAAVTLFRIWSRV
jgi:hypothetical protein